MQSAGHEQLGGKRAFLAMLGICLVVTLTALDQTVVGTALPKIVSDLQGFSYYSWVGSVYLLTSAIFLPLTGKLGDLYGRKPFVLGAIASFTLASVLCGVAQNMPELVIARALQGIGGGMVMGTTFASITDLFPDTARRITWMAMVTTTFGIANAVGPMLGGVMTEHWGWRSVFFVNLPVGLAAAWVVVRFLPSFPGHRQGNERIDWLDALLMATALSVLMLVLEDGSTLGYGSLAFWSLLTAGAAAGGWFGWRLQHVSAPIFPPRVLRLAAAQRLIVLAFLCGSVLFMLVFYVPLLLQGGFGYSPRSAGLLLTPLALGMPVGSLINGRLLSRIRWGHKLLSCGMLCLVLGCYLATRLTAETPTSQMLIVLGLCGLSFGFQFPNLNLQMQSAVDRSDVGAGAALVNTTRTFGSMLAASLTALLVNASYATAVAKALPQKGTEAARALLANPQVLVRESDQAAFATALKPMGIDPLPLLDIAREGLMSGVHHALLIGMALASIGAIIGWKLPTLPLENRELCSLE
ncbi:MAG: MDR family MFS transporter [Formivibrio sp.]|nr:MDR family MFS transporter [Formivibrio sp.]